jgi:quinone-modifying oxidoreductase subunit QmoB
MSKIPKKLGVYICTGCGIGESLDIKKLSNVAYNEYHVNVCSSHPFLCSSEGVDLISNDIKKRELDGVILAACSPRAKTEKYNFNSDTHIERVNLREQVVWCHTPNDEDTQMLAEDNLRMGIVNTQMVSKIIPFVAEDIESDILVIGGGITGVTAALEGARAGYDILLIERDITLGGWAKKLYKQVPYKYPYQSPQTPVIHEKIAELENFPNIKVLTSTEIKKISGQPGAFNVTLIQQGKEATFRVGTIVMATGWKPFDASRLTTFGYGKLKNVITNVEMEEMAAGELILRPSDKNPVKDVLFIQCAGSRDENHLPYCSSFCCATSLKQAKYVRNFNPDSRVYIIYKDIRIPGLTENFYLEVQKDEQIFFTKGEVTGIQKSQDELIVEIKNTLIDEQIFLKVDLVVLATGMTPANTEDINLTYRQGKGLPLLKYNFPDSHFICFPYETRRTGIYTAGALRAPSDITDCMEDATGAVLKAIQCLECVKRGESVHPRSGDRSYPDLYLQRCTDCKRCTEECPFGAYDETEKGTPLPNPNRCRRCGICLGSCPERIINFADFSVNSISSKIKAIKIPGEFEEKPRILAFICENDAYPAFDMAGINRLKYSPYVRIIPVRCIGSVNNVWISDALSQGFDGILQIGCKPGDDYQCHFINGSELISIRAENLQETLQTMMMEPERIKTEFIEITEYLKIPELIDGYIKTIEELGPNPFKGI